MNLQEWIQDLVRSKRIAYLSFDAVSRNGVFDFASLLPAIEAAYRAHYAGETVMPGSDYLKYPNRPSYDRIIPLLGHLGGPFQLSGLKEICSSTRNAALGFPRASGLILLNDPETQRPFAILEASQISAARTAAVTGLAIRLFSSRILNRIAWLGAGYLAETHSRMWAQLFKDRGRTIHFYDPSCERTNAFSNHLSHLNLDAVPETSAEEAIRNADLIIPMTTSETPYIEPDWIAPKVFYSAVSLLDPKLDVLRKARVIVVDDLELCTQEGRPLQQLQALGELQGLTLHTIGQVLSENIEVNPEEPGLIFFNPMGTVITDLAVAAIVFQNAMERKDYLLLDV